MESESGDVLGVPYHLQVPQGFRQGSAVGVLVVQCKFPGGTSVTEGPRAALRTFSPAAKFGGSQTVGPHSSDRQMELADMSGLSSAVLSGGGCGCCTPVPLIGCDGDSESISAGRDTTRSCQETCRQPGIVNLSHTPVARHAYSTVERDSLPLSGPTA